MSWATPPAPIVSRYRGRSNPGITSASCATSWRLTIRSTSRSWAAVYEGSASAVSKARMAAASESARSAFRPTLRSWAAMCVSYCERSSVDCSSSRR